MTTGVKDQLRDRNLKQKELPCSDTTFTSSSDGYYLSQAKYTFNLLSKVGITDNKTVSTPLKYNAKLTPLDGEPISNATRYRQLVGSMIYLTVTRLDISHAMGMVSKFMDAPHSVHYAAVLRILLYDKGTLYHSPHYSSQSSLELHAYSDANWAGDPTDQCYITGFHFLLGTSLVSWCSKKHDVVSRSSTEAEYRALTDTTCKLFSILAPPHVFFNYLFCSYISQNFCQGNLVLKDFDIRKEAGGASFVAVQKEYNNVQVSQNYLEIHLFWAGKGTCCVPAQGTYGPSISAISATPEFTPTVSNSPPSLIVGLVVGVGVVSFLAVFIVFYIVRRRKPPTNDDEELLGIDAKTFTFSYAELKTATEDFNLDNKLGEGGFGPVYKGTLNDGRVIAVKQLSVTSHQGKNQFLTEIATISAVQHRNLVKLYGCCIEGDKRLLVYEYLENKSLDQALFGKRILNLDWSTRFNICLGVARGLAYLHEESRLRIVHRDVKASNILLDSDLIPKISDFGLAKLYDDKKTHISTRVAGTIGYLAPEYAMRGHLTEKADVFAFGVVALELVSGRPNSDSSLEEEKIYLLEWAWQLHENNRDVDLVDTKLSQFNDKEVKRLIGVSLLCTQASPTLRPSMSRVVAMLSGDIEVSIVTSRPGYLTDWKYDDKTNVISEGATDTSYFNSSTASTSIVGDVGNSPANASKPMIGDTIKQGR
ncbi:probable LRR receptor-like serine/threonine-protein kinase At1g56140 [Quercus suber]|uniref:probable LRR receptor-like serine/threonine-protein kinase At1g56140 n=1 Tax=Quercus suber TaxID=58331 RepID=UPI0032DE3792